MILKGIFSLLVLNFVFADEDYENPFRGKGARIINGEPYDIEWAPYYVRKFSTTREKTSTQKVDFS